ncbi:MAG: hypothetical protein NTV98_05410 [Candidatus Roizmanbacteria bacterium]|nr:hypothetical protein [Candidatus Roizmanbacteria bacterium]
MTTFPNIQQEVGTATCGPNCLLNIYESFGIKTSIKEILKDLNVTNKDYTYVPQLASHLNEKNLSTIILSSNPRTVSPTWEKLNSLEIMEKLKKWLIYNKKDEWLYENLLTYFYLQEGGQIKILDLSTNVIDEYIERGFLLISCLNESWIWQQRKIKDIVEYDDIKGKGRGHFVVVYGKEGDEYLISDPYPTKIKDRDGLYKINKQKLLVATLVWDRALIAVKK